jgi:hypothetical protein
VGLLRRFCARVVPCATSRHARPQALDIAVDVCFWLDLLLCFRTGTCCAQLPRTAATPRAHARTPATR